MLSESYDSFLERKGNWTAFETSSLHRKPAKEGLLKIMKWFS